MSTQRVHISVTKPSRETTSSFFVDPPYDCLSILDAFFFLHLCALTCFGRASRTSMRPKKNPKMRPRTQPMAQPMMHPEKFPSKCTPKCATK